MKFKNEKMLPREDVAGTVKDLIENGKVNICDSQKQEYKVSDWHMLWNQ